MSFPGLKTLPIKRAPQARVIALLFLIVALAPAACNYVRGFDFARGQRMTGGNPELGRTKLARHSCVSCHVIPGLPNTGASLAPPLGSWSGRRKFLESVPNTPANLETWIENPSHMKPGTNMPDMNVSPEDSRDMAAYVYSIN